MGLQQECEALRGIPMFAKVDAARLKLLSFTSERVHFMPGEEFIRQGEVGESAYIVLSGTAEALLETIDGQLVIGPVATGQLVGEIALLRQGRRTATVRAKTAVECLMIPRDVFFHLVRECPDFSVAVLRDVAERLERLTAQMRDANRRPAAA